MVPVKDILQSNQIIIDEPALRRGFTVVPNVLFSLKGLSHGARLTYILLLKYAWQEGSCFPGIDRLAYDLEVERKSVMRYTQELQARDLVSIERRGRGITNVYHICRWSEEVLASAGDARMTGLRSRSPMHRTSGNPIQGTSKSPTGGTLQIHSSPRLRRQNAVDAADGIDRKHPAHVAYLVDEILKVCGDKKSTAFYRQVAREVDDHHIFRLLAEIRQDPTIKNRGAVFTIKVGALTRPALKRSL